MEYGSLIVRHASRIKSDNDKEKIRRVCPPILLSPISTLEHIFIFSSTLEQIARHGSSAFYEGEIGRCANASSEV